MCCYNKSFKFLHVITCFSYYIFYLFNFYNCHVGDTLFSSISFLLIHVCNCPCHTYKLHSVILFLETSHVLYFYFWKHLMPCYSISGNITLSLILFLEASHEHQIQCYPFSPGIIFVDIFSAVTTSVFVLFRGLYVAISFNVICVDIIFCVKILFL